MTKEQRALHAEWFDAVVARMLAVDPALGPESAIMTAEEVSRLPRWRELSPEIAARRAVIRQAGKRTTAPAAREVRRAA